MYVLLRCLGTHAEAGHAALLTCACTRIVSWIQARVAEQCQLATIHRCALVIQCAARMLRARRRKRQRQDEVLDERRIRFNAEEVIAPRRRAAGDLERVRSRRQLRNHASFVHMCRSDGEAVRKVRQHEADAAYEVHVAEQVSARAAGIIRRTHARGLERLQRAAAKIQALVRGRKLRHNFAKVVRQYQIQCKAAARRRRVAQGRTSTSVSTYAFDGTSTHTSEPVPGLDLGGEDLGGDAADAASLYSAVVTVRSADNVMQAGAVPQEGRSTTPRSTTSMQSRRGMGLTLADLAGMSVQPAGNAQRSPVGREALNADVPSPRGSDVSVSAGVATPQHWRGSSAFSGEEYSSQRSVSPAASSVSVPVTTAGVVPNGASPSARLARRMGRRRGSGPVCPADHVQAIRRVPSKLRSATAVGGVGWRPDVSGRQHMAHAERIFTLSPATQDRVRAKAPGVFKGVSRVLTWAKNAQERAGASNPSSPSGHTGSQTASSKLRLDGADGSSPELLVGSGHGTATNAPSTRRSLDRRRPSSASVTGSVRSTASSKTGAGEEYAAQQAVWLLLWSKATVLRTVGVFDVCVDDATGREFEFDRIRCVGAWGTEGADKLAAGGLHEDEIGLGRRTTLQVVQ